MLFSRDYWLKIKELILREYGPDVAEFAVPSEMVRPLQVSRSEKVIADLRNIGSGDNESGTAD